MVLRANRELESVTRYCLSVLVPCWFTAFSDESCRYNWGVLHPPVQEQHVDVFLVTPVLKMGFYLK